MELDKFLNHIDLINVGSILCFQYLTKNGCGIIVFSYNYYNKGEVQMLKITDAARDKFKVLMQEHEGKTLRVVFEGFG